MRIVFVHYHVKSGGVTRVLENAVAALATAFSKVETVVLCGEQPPEDCSLPYKVVPGIGYASVDEKIDPHVLADRMQLAAKEFFGKDPDVWHIHNHSLGKNPTVADAVVALAERGCRLLLQIHDFAEDGRPANYRVREDHLQSKSCYPLADNIHYCVLNRRDYSILGEAGIPADQMTWLPNPVVIHDLDYDDDAGASSSLDQMILYPVRAVRRKNLGELLLHACLPSKRRVFMTTLGTTSGDFVDEYQQWKSFTAELGLQVSFEVCQSYGLPFDSVVDHSHCIINTSVAEGFGLGFLEPWVFGKTLIGRDLPEITADFKDMGIQLNRLYESIPIPISVFRFDEFRFRLREVILAYHQQYGVAYEEAWMEDWVASSVQNKCIDFGKLDEIAQREVIESIQGDFYLQKNLMDFFSYEKEPSDIVDRNASIIETELNLKTYGSRLKTIYESLLDQPLGGELSFADSAVVLQSFFSVERFLPLRA